MGKFTSALTPLSKRHDIQYSLISNKLEFRSLGVAGRYPVFLIEDDANEPGELMDPTIGLIAERPPLYLNGSHFLGQIVSDFLTC